VATLMAVHAHPDDEATSTGGVLARYAAEGHSTVVVTCTNGEYGDLPGGIKPDDERHAVDRVVEIRAKELERACEVLGVTHLERLGYRDSGMADWSYKDHPDAFCNVSLDEAATRLAALFDTHRPDVVVTYNQAGGYNHPDHIQASRITEAALELSAIPRKLYLTASRANRFARIREILEEQGVELPPRRPPSPEWVERTREQEARITTTVDVRPYVEQKITALREHASQVGGSHWSRLPAEALAEVFGEEHFIRVRDATGAEAPEDDLFAGLR
jgi:LmbE family N-acetylglucosaminyl deacetylase